MGALDASDAESELLRMRELASGSCSGKAGGFKTRPYVGSLLPPTRDMRDERSGGTSFSQPDQLLSRLESCRGRG